MSDGRKCDDKKHHHIDARLILQFEAGIGYSRPGVKFKSECPALSLKVGPRRRIHESPFLIEFSPPQRLTAVVSISNKSSTRPSV